MKVSLHNSLSDKHRTSFSRINKLLMVSVVLLFIFEALVTNAKASNGSRLVELQEQYDALQLEVTSMELEVTRHSSLSYIKEYASQEMDMEPVDSNILYLPISHPSTSP